MNRFVYSFSNLYGWTVYDRQRGSCPAYEACADLLLAVRIEDDGTLISESPIYLKNEYEARKLCRRLNIAAKAERI